MSLLPAIPVPGPAAFPLLGKAGTLLRFFRDPVRCLQTLHARYGDVAAVSAGDASLVCAFGPELNRQVLSEPDLFHTAAELPIRIPKGSALERLTRFLVGTNGADHKHLRRTLSPLFARSALEAHRDKIVAATESSMAKWNVDQVVDLSTVTSELALAVAFRCLFNLDVRAEARSFAEMAVSFTGGATSPALMVAPWNIPGLPYWRFTRLCERLEQRLTTLISEHRAAGAGDDALSVLINVKSEGGQSLSDAQLLGLANELFIAGHETTARTLAWTLFLLERHPKLENDLVDELKGTLHGDAATLAQLERLPLLDAVVKESMRLLSATPFLFFRRTMSEVQVGKHVLPPGAGLVISPLITHHMPELYAEPNVFKPARWDTLQPGPYAYLPFGAGPRTCLGAAFATMSVRVILSAILQRYRLSMTRGTDVSYQARGVILGTKRGMPMLIRRRDAAPGAHESVTGTIRDLVELT